MQDSPLSGPAQAKAEIDLIPLDGPDERSPVPLLQGELTIGRSAPSDIVIDSRLVSKVHARVRRAGNQLAIDDLKSPNGTFVNGTRVRTTQALRDGDVVSIAGVRQFRVRIAALPAIDQPTPTLVRAPAPAPAAVERSSEETLVRTRDASVVLDGPAGQFTLRPGKNAIGRDKTMAIFIDDRQVSRAHAVITVKGLRVTVEDRESVNGTMVNGEVVKSARPLRSGDKIRFGDLEFTVTIKTASDQ